MLHVICRGDDMKRWETEAMIRHAAGLATSKAGYLLAVLLRTETKTPIGVLNLADSEDGVSIGFGLASRHRGNGYGSEIVAYVTDWLLDQPLIWRVWGYCDEENEASARTMMRGGMRFEGVLRRFALHPNVSTGPRNCKLFASVRA